MDIQEKENLLNSLSKMYLKYSDLDEAYFRVFREIRRLENIRIYVDIIKVQSRAYDCEVE